MAFAIFLNGQDLAAAAAIVQNQNWNFASNDDKNVIQQCWQGGLNGWASAPHAPDPWGSQDADMRIVVINATYKGKTVTLLQMLDAWNNTALANNPDPAAYGGGIIFLNALYTDIRFGGDGRDPWP